MMRTVGVETFVNAHEACGCVICEHSGEAAHKEAVHKRAADEKAAHQRAVETQTIRKDGCTIKIESLVAAIDCDKCNGFASTDMRPDVIGIRRCNEKSEWVILEMKTKMRERAAEQARAALRKLGSDPFFSLDLDGAHIFFVIKHMRKSAATIMRQIKMIESEQWKIVPQLVESGETIGCGHR